ncbi:MAG: hypothetical protein AB7G93_08850 [Bdellovibrionales bacterium]
MNRFTVLSCALFALMSGGCATYNYAQNVKTIAFSDNLEKGQSVGNIRGEDCTWQVLGYQMGGMPTVDRAFSNAQYGKDGSSFAGSMTSGNTNTGTGLRYINNVSTKNDGFNAGLFGKSCIVVTGVGYR